MCKKMKLNSLDSNTNFGWRYTAHRDITALTVNEIPKLKKIQEYFGEICSKAGF